ncbi:MAG: pyrimidine 5'-nucleotidase [Candidatus Nanoarchaeia archaeon]|nr:pyrimidine 5'-nucleotidase [Candidatus Nanoarchaeia archaeon]
MRDIEAIIFDLDNTLYPKEAGLLNEVGNRIDEFICKKFNLDYPGAVSYRKKLFNEYGTTLKGLMIEEKVDPEEYLGFVHNLNAENFLKRNEELIKMLGGIKQKKIIFSNSPREHVLNVIRVLGIEDFFSGIYDIRLLDFNNKPGEDAYNKLVKHSRINPKESMMIDDYENNLKPAKEIGMTTVLVGNGDYHKFPYVDYYITKITEIGGILRE